MTKTELKELIKEVISESSIKRGLIQRQPQSPLEGAVAKNVENHGHYYADMTLVTKDGKKVKGRFEFQN
jgi:methionine-rich copper-binding protein CopC